MLLESPIGEADDACSVSASDTASCDTASCDTDDATAADAAAADLRAAAALSCRSCMLSEKKLWWPSSSVVGFAALGEQRLPALCIGHPCCSAIAFNFSVNDTVAASPPPPAPPPAAGTCLAGLLAVRLLRTGAEPLPSLPPAVLLSRADADSEFRSDVERSDAIGVLFVERSLALRLSLISPLVGALGSPTLASMWTAGGVMTLLPDVDRSCPDVDRLFADVDRPWLSVWPVVIGLVVPTLASMWTAGGVMTLLPDVDRSWPDVDRVLRLSFFSAAVGALGLLRLASPDVD